MSMDSLSIASPCSADWAAMDGTEERRFCVQCQKTVHNLSALAPCEAARLVTESRASRTPICVRFLQGPAGQVLFRAALAGGAAALAGCAPKFEVLLMGDIAVEGSEPVSEPGTTRGSGGRVRPPPSQASDTGDARMGKMAPGPEPEEEPVPVPAPVGPETRP